MLEPLLAAGDGDRAQAVVRDRPGSRPRWPTRWWPTWAPAWPPWGRSPPRTASSSSGSSTRAEGTQLIVHAPYGGRINRALGLALRKRFCVSFDFELQAAADDDTVVLSLGPQHSFPLAQVPKMLQSGTVTEVLTQAILPHPMLAARWRWNLTRALVVPRSRGGQRRPIHLQRMEADDLLAAAWPALAACQENAAPGPVAGPRPRAGTTDGGRLPDRAARRRRPGGAARRPRSRPGRGPPGRIRRALAPRPRHPDRAPLHLPRRRSPRGAAHPGGARRPGPGPDRTRRAASGLPVAARSWGPSIAPPWPRCSTRCDPRPRDADELHDLLLSLVLCRPVPAWQEWFEQLGRDGRAGLVGGAWVATERLAHGRGVAGSMADPLVAADEAVAECVGRPSRGVRSGHRRAAGGDEPLPVGFAARRPGHRGPGPHRAGPAGGGRARPSSCPMAAGVHATCWFACTPPAGDGGADTSSQPACPTSCASSPAGNTWPPAPRPRAARAAGGRRTAPGSRGGCRRVGAPHPARPGRRLRPPMARRAVPGRRGGLGQSHPAARARAPGRRRPADRAGSAPTAGLAGGGSSTPSPATPLAIVARQDLAWMLAAVRADRNPIEPTAGASADILAALRPGCLFPVRAGARLADA